MNAPPVPTIAVSKIQVTDQDQTSYPNDIRAKIIHTLSIFPVLSPSMLQIGLGPASAAIWRPVLRELITEGVITEDVLVTPTPSGRHQAYTLLALVNK